MSARLLALDASVGVKWFRSEAGSDEARSILVDAAEGRTRIAVPAHFVCGVIAVVQRTYGAGAVLEAWRDIDDTDIIVIGLDEGMVAEAASQCEALGCSFYDALAPAAASLLGATLVSADARAHAAFPGVRLIG